MVEESGADGAVDIWYLDHTTLAPTLADALSAVLTESERHAARRYRDQVAARSFIARRAMRRSLLGAYLGRSPDRIAVMSDTGGKPRLAGPANADILCFNAAASRGCAVIAFTRGRPIGIDIEYVRPDIGIDDMLATHFTVDEQAFLSTVTSAERTTTFFVLWTRKEALFKGLGIGLGGAFADVSVMRPSGPSGTISMADTLSDWRLTDLCVLDGYAAALAIRGTTTEIRVNRWCPETVPDANAIISAMRRPD